DIVKRKDLEKEAEREQRYSSPEYLKMDPPFIDSDIDLFAEPKRDRHAHNKEEKREDPVRGCCSVPFGMGERRIDRGPASGLIDQDHRRDRHTAKYVKGQHPVQRWLGRGSFS